MEVEKVELSEKLIKDLYIDLRKKVNKWSEITKQTPQARMGYVGQHLASIVTGFPGGKSGARGYDMIIDDSDRQNIKSAEIKTCYRVDQLGKCNECNSVVSSLEKECSFCGSKNIKRNDDSKWLITMKREEDLELTFEPIYYYFVLFEFEEINNPDNSNIIASIWRVKTNEPGFFLCMLDYYYNIRANSESKAPFNMWPHMLKFHLTKPVKIYESVIFENDNIETRLLDNSRKKEDELCNLENYIATNIHVETLKEVCKILNIGLPTKKNKKELLKYLQEKRKDISNSDLADVISYAMYYKRIEPHIKKMPRHIQDRIGEIQESIL
jgi:hypothetical protein